MKTFLQCKIGHMGLKRGPKGATCNISIMLPDLRINFASVLIYAHTSVSCRISNMVVSVPIILRSICQSQIANSVIRHIPIDMINIIRGPFSMHPKPSESVCIEPFAKSSDLNVSVGFSSNAMVPAPPSGGEPPKASCFWIIGQKFAQLFLRELDFFTIHGMGRPSGTDRLAIKNPLSGQTLSGFAPCTTNLG